MFQYMHYLFNETEIRFYRKYKLFPDELFQQLQNPGFLQRIIQTHSERNGQIIPVTKRRKYMDKSRLRPVHRVAYLTIATL